MEDQKNNKEAPASSPDFSRRDFFTTVGAVAAGMLGAKGVPGQSNFPVFQDSFGNVAPAAGDALNVGVYPPPVYTPPANSASTVTPNYVQPNILMIMVDQLRSPRWLPAGGQTAIDQLLPNIAFLRDHSFSFPNYFVAATDCTPCRATLLTGLYSQQTFMFRTQTSSGEPALHTGFPTFGTALSQQANYATCWIGKWHLSDAVPQASGFGPNGPGDYGFTAGALNLPKNSSVASPNGYANEGTDGYNAPPYGSGTPIISPPPLTNEKTPLYTQINDGAIANWFVNTWLPTASSSQPWFTAVSFVNPHDITAFPASFGFPPGPDFGTAALPLTGYQPPSTNGVTYDSTKPDAFIPPLGTSLYPSGGTPPSGWNVADDPLLQPYGAGTGKPSLQASFSHSTNQNCGAIQTTNGWFTFLNYYFWMQSCVDYQIGRVLDTLASSSFASKTIIIFTSDHGDYGGSHNLHTKGGALYDESINVPLYVSFPKMRPPFAPAPTGRTRPFVCSSVDIFPLLYTLALGNSGWRNNSSDPYSYLSGREAILDAILSTSPQQRRVSTILNNSGSGYLPYVLHTTDEFTLAYSTPGVQAPSRAIAFRTVDTGVTSTIGGATYYGGAKLGIYSYWATCSTRIDPQQPQQFEFYDYTAGNYSEVGNQAFNGQGVLDTRPSAYLAAFNAIAATELYFQFPQFQSAAAAALSKYLSYIGGDCTSGSD